MRTNGRCFVHRQTCNRFICCLFNYFALLGHCVKVSYEGKLQEKVLPFSDISWWSGWVMNTEWVSCIDILYFLGIWTVVLVVKPGYFLYEDSKFSIQHILSVGVALAVSNGAEGATTQSHSHLVVVPDTILGIFQRKCHAVSFCLPCTFLKRPLGMLTSFLSCPFIRFSKIKGFVLHYLCFSTVVYSCIHRMIIFLLL